MLKNRNILNLPQHFGLDNVGIIIISSKGNFSRHDTVEKIAHLALSQSVHE
jgi:hypothetical protein